MSAPAIEAVGLGKRYCLHARGESTVLRHLKAMVAGGRSRELWAVKGVDLTVEPGECVGVIGPNGAGKTTLLMLLGGLVEPTEGSVTARGRIGPFFRVGSGLYPELSVMDNIRLAAVLFGMTRRQLVRRLDEIVAFGGLEPYLFARLGELSAGYQIRVPFSTALFADLDVLLLDEIFSVGDNAFQQLCLDKMSELRSQGKTMVFASHDLERIRSWSNRVIHLQNGILVRQGSPDEVTRRYLAETPA